LLGPAHQGSAAFDHDVKIKVVIDAFRANARAEKPTSFIFHSPFLPQSIFGFSGERGNASYVLSCSMAIA
jgi:hypothetical protein